MFLWHLFSEISFFGQIYIPFGGLGGGKARRLKKFYLPHIIFNMLGPPWLCSTVNPFMFIIPWLPPTSRIPLLTEHHIHFSCSCRYQVQTAWVPCSHPITLSQGGHSPRCSTMMDSIIAFKVQFLWKFCEAHGFFKLVESSKILHHAMATAAFHNSGKCFDPPKCHPNTQSAVLTKIIKWIK